MAAFPVAAANIRSAALGPHFNINTTSRQIASLLHHSIYLQVNNGEEAVPHRLHEGCESANSNAKRTAY